MATTEKLLQAIEVIHAAGLDADLWPDALAAVTHLCGGLGATLEVFDKAKHRHREFHAFGIPAPGEIAYIDQYAVLNPRMRRGLRENEGDIGWDYLIADEAALARDPFYSEFLTPLGLRYFVSGTLRQTPQEFAAIAVQRTPAQGHVVPNEIKLMEQIVPHFRQALDVASRLDRDTSARNSLEGALDWLADGVALLDRDGTAVYVNASLQDIARRRDGIAIKKGVLVFESAETRSRFAAAFGALSPLRDGGGAGLHDFAAGRASNAPPYLVSLRPLTRGHRELNSNAIAIVFVRDPQRRDPASGGLLTDLFGLTPAEASLAQAIQIGIPLSEYARQRGVSLNTVYTHLRRIKEKTGCNRMAELVHKLNDLRLPLCPP